LGTELRDTGISAVGALPWGAHFCHFYETKEDLLDILIPYFKVGLESNEFCIWAVLDPLNEEEATNAGCSVFEVVPRRQYLQCTAAHQHVESKAHAGSGERLRRNQNQW
jgi:hypothetical protein